MEKQNPVYTLKNECNDCYKCIRGCHIKAIRIQNGSASVINEKCVACGHCVTICPAGAKKVRNDIDVVKALFLTGKKVFVSLAPSWAGVYNISKEKAIFAIYSGGGRFGWTACGKLYKRELLLKYPFPVGFYEDAAIMYKLLNECNVCAIGGDNKINYHYVTREGSILKRGLEQKHFHIFDICEEFSRFISCYYPDMSVLPILFYRRAVTQLLNLQRMDNTTYEKIFLRYIKVFRMNLLKVLMNKHISVKSKYYMIWLCTTPFMYKMQYFIMQKINKG